MATAAMAAAVATVDGVILAKALAMLLGEASLVVVGADGGPRAAPAGLSSRRCAGGGRWSWRFPPTTPKFVGGAYSNSRRMFRENLRFLDDVDGVHVLAWARNVLCRVRRRSRREASSRPSTATPAPPHLVGWM